MEKYMEIFLASELQFKSSLNRQQSSSGQYNILHKYRCDESLFTHRTYKYIHVSRQEVRLWGKI